VIISVLLSDQLGLSVVKHTDVLPCSLRRVGIRICRTSPMHFLVACHICFTGCIQKQAENLSVRHCVTDSAHLRHHFTVSLRLVNLCFINFNHHNNNNVLNLALVSFALFFLQSVSK